MSFEVIAARVTVGSKCFLLVVVYRPGAAAVRQCFFHELADLLDRVATNNDTLYITGDFNFRFDRPDDVHTQRL
jgi:hypothetical protein